MALAPPAEKDGFSYAGDALYREASNLNRHRRATLPELQAHFKGKDATGDNNRPAHWYEAQLLHYGLPPSKVKGTAHKRLFDAVTKGGLAVPAHITKIEAELKKEWTKREREAKKMVKASAGPAAPAKGMKRKADQVSTTTSVNVNVSVQVSNSGKVTVQAAQPTSKKPKAAPVTTATKANPSKSTAVKPASKKATASPTARKTATPTAKTTTPKAPKTVKPPPKPKTTPKQTAQASSGSGLGAVPRSAKGTGSSAFKREPSLHDDEAPPPYSEYASGPVTSSKQPKQEHSSPPSSSQPRIGLLNGRYRVSCKYIEAYHSEYAQDMGLIATLDGSNLWLKFDFGIATGMIKLSRPQEADPDYPHWAFWRGEALDEDENWQPYYVDTVQRVGQRNHVYFMGGGHIRGKLQYGPPGAVVELDFDAYRLSGQSMTSEVSPSQARADWARLDN